MLIGFGILLIYSSIFLYKYFTMSGGMVITNKEIYVSGEPLLLSMISTLAITSLLTIIGILLDAKNESSIIGMKFKLTRGQDFMLTGFFCLFLWSIALLVKYFIFSGVKITKDEIYIIGQPIVLTMSLTLMVTALLTIIGILLDIKNDKPLSTNFSL